MMAAADVFAAVWGAVWVLWVVDRPREDEAMIKVTMLYNLPAGIDEAPVR